MKYDVTLGLGMRITNYAVIPFFIPSAFTKSLEKSRSNVFEIVSITHDTCEKGSRSTFSWIRTEAFVLVLVFFFLFLFSFGRAFFLNNDLEKIIDFIKAAP